MYLVIGPEKLFCALSSLDEISVILSLLES